MRKWNEVNERDGQPTTVLLAAGVIQFVTLVTGQSDIKKLRRENDHLRREIWSLRDEYDRLDKLLRANPQQGVDIGERPTPAERTIVYEEGDEEEEDEEEEEGDEDEEEEQICEHCQQYEV